MKPSNVTCIITITLILFVSQVIYAQTWEEIEINLPDGQIASSYSKIIFANKDIGWLCTEKLYKTTDGGENWQSVSLNNVRDFSVAIIYSLEPDFFYMVNSDPYGENPSDALFTRDGGNTWTSKQIINDVFRAIHFFDKEKGIIVGGHSWTTKDGGLTWIRGGKIKYFVVDIYFHNESLGWTVVSGEDVNYVANTTDGGRTWEYLNYQTPAFFVGKNEIAFVDSLKGFIIGDVLSKTTDGGKNWDTDYNVYGYDIGFLDNKHGWIGGYRQILRTTDSGETWEAQLEGPVNFSFRKIIILKRDKTAYALGYSTENSHATLFRADLSDLTEVEEKNKTIPEEFYLLQNYPNPFNPSTTISYDLPEQTEVSIKIFDISGRLVSELANSTQSAGHYSIVWNGTNSAGERVGSGMYVVRLSSKPFSASQKVLLLK